MHKHGPLIALVGALLIGIACALITSAALVWANHVFLGVAAALAFVGIYIVMMLQGGGLHMAKTDMAWADFAAAAIPIGFGLVIGFCLVIPSMAHLPLAAGVAVAVMVTYLLAVAVALTYKAPRNVHS